MKKLLSPLSLAILALALIFSSVAYAKKGGNKPGDDNPGSTTLSVPFFAAGFVGYGYGCFDYDDWCASEYAYIVEETATSGNPGDSAYAAANGYLGCNASASAGASFEQVFFAEGVLDLTRHGLNGAMHHIELQSNFSTFGGVYLSAGAHASAMAQGSAYVYAGTNDFIGWHDYCVWADYNTPSGDPVVQDLCLYLDQYQWGEGWGGAYAQGHADGWSSAGSNNASGMSQWVGVWAANIERFQSVTSAGASNFSWSTASANADALAEAYVEAYMSNWYLACADLFDLEYGGFYSLCADGAASAYAYAYSWAQSFIAAQAEAWTETQVGMILPATYVNEDGNVDTVYFGDPSAVTWAQGTMNVSCSAGGGGMP